MTSPLPPEPSGPGYPGGNALPNPAFAQSRQGPLWISVFEVDQDLRSDEKTIALKIQNLSGEEPIQILKIDHHLPEGVEYKELWSSSILSIEEKKRRLCQDLTLLVNDEFFFSPSDLQKRRREMVKDFIQDVLGERTDSVGRVLALYTRLLNPILLRSLANKFRNRYEASRVTVDNYRSAQRFLDQLKELPTDEHPNLISTIQLKTTELKELEEASGKAARSTLQPHGELVEFFILRFAKGAFRVKKYSMSFSITYATQTTQDDENHPVARASHTVDVTPREVILSTIAMFFGALGTLLKTLTAGQSFDFMNLGTYPLVGMAMGSILALLVFNLFERLGLSLENKIKVDWVGASTVGFACGFVNERLLQVVLGPFI